MWLGSKCLIFDENIWKCFIYKLQSWYFLAFPENLSNITNPDEKKYIFWWELNLFFPWQILNQITKDKREYKCSRIDFQVVLFLLGTMGKSVFWNFVRIFNSHARSVITLKAIKNSIATSKWPWPDCVGSIMNEAEAILGQRLSRAESRRNWVGWGQEGQKELN